jgi:single-strand DNA-binding protein
MNRVILMGRLTRDPDIRYSQGEQATAIAKYTLAVDRRFKRANDTQTADFISCTAFGRSAEFAEKYLRKGMKIAVTGRIQTGSYTNREGVKVYTTDVIVEDHEFVESKAASEQYAASMPQQSFGGPAPAAAPSPADAVGDGFMNIPDGIDEELPFN